MFAFSRPSELTIRRFLDAQAQLPFSYPAVGSTAHQPPPGYKLDHTRVAIGHGQPCFEHACQVLRRWGQFNVGWVHAWSPDTPIQNGQVVAVVAHLFGLWWLSACRIVYVIDDTSPTRRFGFAYGTLPDHAGSGEERFLVEWDPQTDTVWYDILAFSRPQWLIARLAYPYMRRLQRRFARDSSSAMLPNP